MRKSILFSTLSSTSPLRVIYLIVAKRTRRRISQASSTIRRNSSWMQSKRFTSMGIQNEMRKKERNAKKTPKKVEKKKKCSKRTRGKANVFFYFGQFNQKINKKKGMSRFGLHILSFSFRVSHRWHFRGQSQYLPSSRLRANISFSMLKSFRFSFLLFNISTFREKNARIKARENRNEKISIFKIM